MEYKYYFLHGAGFCDLAAGGEAHCSKLTPTACSIHAQKKKVNLKELGYPSGRLLQTNTNSLPGVYLCEMQTTKHLKF